MNCEELAARIQSLQPDATPVEVARICLLLTNYVGDLGELDDEDRLENAWREMGIRLQAATDQHAAMTAELEQLSQTPPDDFTLREVWALIRAIKVQGRILQFYIGQPTVDA